MPDTPPRSLPGVSHGLALGPELLAHQHLFRGLSPGFTRGPRLLAQHTSETPAEDRSQPPGPHCCLAHIPDLFRGVCPGRALGPELLAHQHLFHGVSPGLTLGPKLLAHQCLFHGVYPGFTRGPRLLAQHRSETTAGDRSQPPGPHCCLAHIPDLFHGDSPGLGLGPELLTHQHLLRRVSTGFPRGPRLLAPVGD